MDCVTITLVGLCLYCYVSPWVHFLNSLLFISLESRRFSGRCTSLTLTSPATSWTPCTCWRCSSSSCRYSQVVTLHRHWFAEPSNHYYSSVIILGIYWLDYLHDMLLYVRNESSASKWSLKIIWNGYITWHTKFLFMFRMCSLVLREQRSFSESHSAVPSVDAFPRRLGGTSLHADGFGAELLAAHPCRHNPLARSSKIRIACRKYNNVQCPLFEPL